jgi:transcriptional regulator GlxA family with amidase domain
VWHHRVVRIDIIVYDGVDELDVIGPLEVLRRAAQAGADLTVRLVTRVAVDHVTGSCGLHFRPDAVFTPDADVVVVPGGGWVARDDHGAWGEVRRGDWLPLLALAAGQGSVMAGVCTGTMLLAHAGVVGDLRATTHHQARHDLTELGVRVVGERVVDEGRLVTAGGVTSGIDLALWLVERWFGSELADGVASALEYPRYTPARPADTPASHVALTPAANPAT